MKYKLMNENTNRELPIVEQVLLNRGIQDPRRYLNLSDKDLHSYNLFGISIKQAVQCLEEHMEKESKIGILQDPDLDGVCSTAILYNYLSRIYKKEKLTYILHTNKSHGLDRNVVIPKDIQLLILPDAGTNDCEQIETLMKSGLSVIVLDHHQIEKSGNPAIIVNPWACDYPNKNLSGGAVVYKFLQVLDDSLWLTYAEDYLDLVALSLIGDSMDLNVYENKRLVDKGLGQIKNKAFVALLKKQEFSTSGIINITNIQFYISPLVNGLIRVGTSEDKEMLLRAFLETDETFDYVKRGEKEPVKEVIYDRVARIATNAKAKQNREIDKAIEQIEKEDIQMYKRLDNKILFTRADGIDGAYTGLICMKLASKYSKPCVLLKENTYKPEYFGGSIRNFDGSPIEDLKSFLLSTNLFESIVGHSNAAGINCEKSKIHDIINQTNIKLENVDFDKCWKVDFVLQPEDIDYKFVNEINQMKDTVECLIAIENICINTSDIQVMGENKTTWKFSLNDEITVIKFKCNDDPILQLIAEDWGGSRIKLNLVGKVSFNVFNGIVQPQIIVSDYEIL
jgi:single-stranded-DNA-specific exonuclease